ncbi:MAG: hypothetical protein JXX29_00605, partial [Deltaproteobacteria bacterium]|nr:hypothetical protein [Deltaproteobacteria bacterium]
MNTTAMVLTISGFCFCFVPGGFGWLGIALSTIGISIGIIGLTNTKTSPSGLGMDVASWVYGIITASFGLSFQIKHAAGSLDFMLLPMSMQAAAFIALGTLPIFIAIQIFARKKMRWAGVGVAWILFAAVSACSWTALTAAERAG